MTHEFTHEMRAHRRAYRLHQDELAHLLGVTPTMIHRMEKGARAQLADVEAILGLEVVFGKSPSQIFTAFYAAVEEAVIRRAAALEAVWRTLDDAKAKANLALLDEIVARVKITPDGA
jgi:transcriptional regulator with XRE-family HTH domain